MRNLILLLFAVCVAAAAISIFGSGDVSAEGRESSRFEAFSAPDAVTAAIRDPRRDLLIVRVRDVGDRAEIAALGETVADYGSFVVVAVPEGIKSGRLDGRELEATVHLPGAAFDPLKTARPGTIAPNDGSGAKDGYYIVQFGGIVNDDWLGSIRDAGAEIIQYVPHQAFIVRAGGEAIGKIAGHSRVRWVGEYRAEDKLSPEVLGFRAAAGARAMFDVAVFARATPGPTAESVGSVGSVEIRNWIGLPTNFFNVVRIEADPRAIDEIAALPDVFRIDPYERPRIEDERAAQIVAGNYTSPTVIAPPGYNPLSQFGVNGTNVTVSVVDDGVSVPGAGGFYITSANTVDGPLRGATVGAEGGHGHINASIIAGRAPFGALDPTGYNYGLGIAPGANIVNIPFLKTGNTTTDAQAVEDTLLTAGPNGVTGYISNNSWGSGTNSNSYDSYAAMYDGFVQDGTSAPTFDPIVIVFSAGNSGTSGLTRPKVAKNVIAVANSENIRTELGTTGADNMDDLRSTSSRGIAADGRIKPDITAPGTVITGSRAGSCGSVSSCFDANHAYSTGTSHAAPQVAGAAALFTEFWKNSNSGQNPSPALVKAAIINSGREMNGNITNASTIPNGNEGWGRIALSHVFDTSVPIKRVNQTTTFSSPGESVVYSGTVGSAAKPFRVSLVWTDPPGAGNPALVNNLDLTVQVGPNVYRGNVFTGGVSTTGGTSSTIDNIENVFLAAGVAPGTPVTITVNAVALNGNGVPGNADSTDQHFALVAYNFSEQNSAPRPRADFDGDSRTDVSIFRPSVGEWWYLRSSDGGNRAFTFGNSSDVLAPADFTGDGKADLGLFRPASGTWFVFRSEDSSFYSFPFGAPGDIPLPYDFDGDGKADAGIFRPATATWYIQRSGGGTTILGFGAAGDVPAIGDYDGDGQADIAIYRPSLGQWWIRRSSTGAVYAFTFGTSTDRIVQGDYTGDGKTDAAIFRPSSGTWFVLRSEDSSFFSVPFGVATDQVSPGDYDGDGKSDFAVFRQSAGTWYIQRSASGLQITAFGASTDVSVPNSLVP